MLILFLWFFTANGSRCQKRSTSGGSSHYKNNEINRLFFTIRIISISHRDVLHKTELFIQVRCSQSSQLELCCRAEGSSGEGKGGVGFLGFLGFPFCMSLNSKWDRFVVLIWKSMLQLTWFHRGPPGLLWFHIHSKSVRWCCPAEALAHTRRKRRQITGVGSLCCKEDSRVWSAIKKKNDAFLSSEQIWQIFSQEWEWMLLGHS